MSTGHYEVTSEVAYDLMQDHMDVMLELLNGPKPQAEIARRLGSDATLQRMLRHGLIGADGTTAWAVAEVYHQLRQEGMLSFLERYVLPALTASMQYDVQLGDTLTTLQMDYLKVPNAQGCLRHGPVQRFIERIAEISDLPAQGPVYRLTVLVVGTSRVDPRNLPLEKAVLEHVRSAAIQRTSSTEKDHAVLSQIDCLADRTRHDAILTVISDFSKLFSSYKISDPSTANYHLTVASHWRQSDPTQAEEQPC